MKNLLILVVAFTFINCNRTDADEPNQEETTEPTIVTDDTIYEAEDCDAPLVSDTLPDGFYKMYHPDSITLKFEGHIKSGYADGFWKEFRADGTPVYEGNYTNRKIEGFRKDFFPNGNESNNGHYKNCKKNGFWKYFHESTGAVMEEGNYTNGLKTGDWKTYDVNGELLTIQRFNS